VWQNGKIFAIAMIFPQALDFPGLGLEKTFPGCPTNTQPSLDGPPPPPLFHNFFVFCRKPTCTQNLVRA
jgi:hypothetical protein